MKRFFFLIVILGVVSLACATSATPAAPDTGVANDPSPISKKELKLTAQVLAQQTLDALPTNTIAPSPTSAINTATNTITPTVEAIQSTATETPNPVLLTLTATLGTGTPNSTLSGAAVNSTATFNSGAGMVANLSPTTTQEVVYPQTYGTLPPNVASGKVTANNQAKTPAYISVHCTTKDGYVSIIEYPIGKKSKIGIKSPAGSCSAVVWVDGKRFSTSFSLTSGGNVTLVITNQGVTQK